MVTTPRKPAEITNCPLRYASASCGAFILELDNAQWETDVNSDTSRGGEDNAVDGAVFQNTTLPMPKLAKKARLIVSELASHFKRIAVSAQCQAFSLHWAQVRSFQQVIEEQLGMLLTTSPRF